MTDVVETDILDNRHKTSKSRIQVFICVACSHAFTPRRFSIVHVKKRPMKNIIARFNPNAEKQILLGAHWDTRPWSDKESDIENQNMPIMGANDGASGVAVLLEITHILKSNPAEIGVTIVFFDGEDLGMSGDNTSYALGSQYFAKNLPIPNPISPDRL